MIALVIMAGVAVGCLSAMFGVGGGVLMVPFMVLMLDKSQHLAEGTSLLVIVPTAVVGVVVHRRSGFVSFRHGSLLALGGIGGAWVGAMVALQVPAETLQMVFGAFMAVIGLRTVRHGIKQMKAERHPPNEDGTDPPADEPPPSVVAQPDRS